MIIPQLLMVLFLITTLQTGTGLELRTNNSYEKAIEIIYSSFLSITLYCKFLTLNSHINCFKLTHKRLNWSNIYTFVILLLHMLQGRQERIQIQKLLYIIFQGEWDVGRLCWWELGGSERPFECTMIGLGWGAWAIRFKGQTPLLAFEKRNNQVHY